MARYAKRTFAGAVDDVASGIARTATRRSRRRCARSTCSTRASSQAKDRLGAELDARQDVIGSNLDAVRHEVRTELTRLGELVVKMGESSALRFGQVDESLRSHAEVARTLSDSTRSLREALASPQARGQWGERMAEDVLRLAGFTENVNYRKQAQLTGSDATGRGAPTSRSTCPRATCCTWTSSSPCRLPPLPRRRPATASAPSTSRRSCATCAPGKELSRRNYSEGGKPSVDYVLLFLPNEQLTGFIHEHDPALLDDALWQRVVMCSPLTLFAFLGVIRQAFDNFMIEQTSDEILKLVGEFVSSGAATPSPPRR